MYTWIEDYAKTLAHVTLVYKVEWGAMRLMVGEKSFGMIGEDNTGRPIMTLKLPPSEGEQLRIVYADKVVPGYYSNKVHWNSFYLDSDLSEDLMKSMLVLARDTLIASFSKKKQIALANAKLDGVRE